MRNNGIPSDPASRRRAAPWRPASDHVAACSSEFTPGSCPSDVRLFFVRPRWPADNQDFPGDLASRRAQEQAQRSAAKKGAQAIKASSADAAAAALNGLDSWVRACMRACMCVCVWVPPMKKQDPCAPHHLPSQFPTPESPHTTPTFPIIFPGMPRSTGVLGAARGNRGRWRRPSTLRDRSSWRRRCIG